MKRFEFVRFLGAAMIGAVLAAVAHAEPPEPSGHLFISSFMTDSVLRYDERTGDFVDEFVPRFSGGLTSPEGLVFGPHDHNLYVVGGFEGGPGQTKAVFRYDGTDGTFLGEFTEPGHLTRPVTVLFGPDDNLYVADVIDFGTPAKIVRFNGTTGAFMDDFVEPLVGGVTNPLGMAFAPSVENPMMLDLYICSYFTNSVLRYDGATGDFKGTYAVVDGRPLSLTFGPDGNLYVTSDAQRNVLRFQGPAGSSPGVLIDTFVPAGSGGLLAADGLLFGPDGNEDGEQDLYVTTLEWTGSFKAKKGTSGVKRYDGVTGAFIDTFITPDSGGLRGPDFLTFTQTDPVTLQYLGRPAQHAVIHGVPEPSSLLLANLGAAAMAAYGWLVRSRRKLSNEKRRYQPRLEALEQRLAMAPCFPSFSPTVRIGDATVLEGDSGRSYAEFTVTFTQGRFAGARTVGYATADGTATLADADYRAASGTLTFASGETSKTIRVAVTGDRDLEADENFVVNLSNARSGGCAVRYLDRQGVGTIRDDDFADNRVDDFNDGDDAGWSHLDFTAGQPWGPATYDASSGAYRLESAGAVPPDDPAAGVVAATWEASRGNTAFGHGVVRGIVRANTPGTTVGFLLRANDTPGTDHDYGFYASSSFGTFYIERFDITQNPPQTILAMADPAQVPFAAGEDWYLEGSVVGNRISLKAWKVGTPEPASTLLSVRDRTFGPEDGTLLCVIAMIDPAAVSEPVQVSGTFDAISFTPLTLTAGRSRMSSDRGHNDRRHSDVRDAHNSLFTSIGGDV